LGSAATIKNDQHLSDSLSKVVEGDGEALAYKQAKDFQLSSVFHAKSVPQWHLETVFHETMACPMSVARTSIRSLISADYVSALAHLDPDTLPTLLIWGEHDAMFPEHARKNLSASILESEVKIIPNAGHSAQWEQPAAFARLLNDFIIHEPATDAKQKDQGELAEGSGVIVACIFFVALGLPVLLLGAAKSVRYDRIVDVGDEQDDGGNEDSESTTI
jgi:hypothetical protein